MNQPASTRPAPTPIFIVQIEGAEITTPVAAYATFEDAAAHAAWYAGTPMLGLTSRPAEIEGGWDLVDIDDPDTIVESVRVVSGVPFVTGPFAPTPR